MSVEQTEFGFGDLGSAEQDRRAADVPPSPPPGKWREVKGFSSIERRAYGPHGPRRLYEMPEEDILVRWHDGWREVEFVTSPKLKNEPRMVTTKCGRRLPVSDAGAFLIGEMQREAVA